MALSRTAPSPGSTGWFPVARAADVGGAPRAVGAGGRSYVVVRLRPGAEVTALAARCPHRLVPLTAGTVVDGTLQCAGHDWRFNAEGRCVDIPSLGVDGTPPPRADLSTPWAVEERDGWVWIAPDRTLHARPPRAVAGTTAEAVPPLPGPAGPVFGLDPSLEHAWHPVALAGELREGGWLAVRLLGRTWTVQRNGGALVVDPPAWGVRERSGVVWLAPAEPRAADLDVPETDDPHWQAVWLPPTRSSAPAGTLADAFLDVSRPPLRRPAAVEADPEVPGYVVRPEVDGFSAVLVSAAGARRSYTVRAPFQLSLRVDDDAGPRMLLSLLQPEDEDSTRVYTCLLLRAGDDAVRVPRSVVAAEVSALQAVLTEDLARLELAGTTGLPLTAYDEVHVPADRLGVALRRALSDFVVAARTPAQEEDDDVAA